MDEKELQALRIEIAKRIYVEHTVEYALRRYTEPNFESNLKPAKTAFQYADYFIAASLKESPTLKALKRRINEKFGTND